ncbi:potassium channel subfamily K member 1-like isoform X2 [Ornithodoros turicata]
MRLARSNVRLLVLLAFYFLFVVIGASIFSAIEAPHENSIIRSLRNKRAMFLEEHPCVSDEALENFIVEIVKAHENRVSPIKNVTNDPNWSFGHSFFFSSTIITTIGYGNITPLSTGGKIFCIVYGLIGIPLTLILLSAFVERLLIPVTYLLQFLNSRLGHLYQAFNIRVLHLFIVGLLVVVLFFLVPATIFSYLEPEWNYVDSLYYCFISLTTIGLGDYTPGDSYNQPYRPLYKVAVVGYLLIGLTSMMLLLNVLYDIPQLNIGIFFLLKSDEMTNDPEKVRLHHGLGPKYTQQVDEPAPPSIRHIKAHPPLSSSSPEDNP